MQPNAALGFLAGVALLLVATAACSESNSAQAQLKDPGGRVVGEASLTATSDAGGVEIYLRVHDLPPGTHGVHIHDVGRCDPPEFTSAAGHFNSGGKQHGLENPNGPHNGDLPNLIVQPDGAGALKAVTARLQDLGEGQNFFNGDGVALVIHGGPDDQTSDPSGNSGPRIACGQIIHD